MAMSEIERKRRRAEASRRCYLKRKAALAAQNKAGAKPVKKTTTTAKKTAKPVKKVEARKAKKAVAKPTAAEAKAAKQVKVAEKLLAKLISKGQKPTAAAKALVKESAQVVTEVFKTGDQALIEKARAQLEKKLGLVVGDGTVTLSLDKAFKAPKAQAAAPTTKPAAKKSKDEEEVLDVMAHSRDGLDNVEHTELPVDPTIAAALRDGADPKEAGVPDADEDEQDSDDPDADPEDADEGDQDDDDDDDDDDEEKDPDEEAEEAAEADIEGRRDTLEELEAMGVGEED